MATHKNATIRYQALDKCFRNPGRKYFIEDLIEACNDALFDVEPTSSGIKRRQVYKDIKFMQDSRGFNAPIESYKEGRRTYYRYSELNFSINNQPLNEQEAQQLKESLLTLSRLKGMPQFEWVEEMRLRLDQSFKLDTSDYVMSFEENPYLKGREYIGELYQAIVNKQVLTITYRPFTSEKNISLELHPYHLKQYNNRWFLLGLNEEYRNLSNIALDRIQSISETQIDYCPNVDVDFEEYFEDVVGVTVSPGDSEKILLKVDADLWPYIQTKPIHGSQKMTVVSKDVILVKLEVIPNYELTSLILSYGDKIEVLEPLELRNEIKEKVENLYKKYISADTMHK